jgi:hypothetical protein
MPLTSQTVTVHFAEGACGIEKSFNTKKQSELWLKLHKKKCPICATKRNIIDEGGVSMTYNIRSESGRRPQEIISEDYYANLTNRFVR